MMEESLRVLGAMLSYAMGGLLEGQSPRWPSSESEIDMPWCVGAPLVRTTKARTEVEAGRRAKTWSVYGGYDEAPLSSLPRQDTGRWRRPWDDRPDQLRRPDAPLDKGNHPSPPSNVVHTAKRRKHETCSILHHKKMEAEKREMAPGVVVAELEMTRVNKSSTDRSVLMNPLKRP